MQPRLRIALPLLPLLLIGCTREPVSSPGNLPVARGSAGLMEITITGIGTPQQRASVRAFGVDSTGVALARSTTRGAWRTLGATAQTGRLTQFMDGTVDIVGVSTASFTYGTRGAGGYRYVSATFEVRNGTSAHTLGTANSFSAQNLTFLAATGVNTHKTLGDTPISVLKTFDGTDITSGLETEIEPTGWADLSGNATLSTRAPDVLQLYTEAEVAPSELPLPTDVTSILPYGFVVRNRGSSTTRTLDESPALDNYQGLVTFAFKVPLQSGATLDPFTISMLFYPVTDTETVVTQSFEDSDATSVAAVAARASALSAHVRSLVGTVVGTQVGAFMCTVRTAGTASVPTSFLGSVITVSSENPPPYVAAASYLSPTASLSATLDSAVSGLSSTSFVVNGSKSGRAFLSGSYTGDGTATVTSPAGAFLPGEEVEVALTPRLLGSAADSRVCPYVYRYRVARSGGTAAFTKEDFGARPWTGQALLHHHSITVGDLDEDGNLDLAVANTDSNSVIIFRGAGDGTFAADAPRFTVGKNPNSIALADFNADGHLDLVTANFGDNTVTVRLGNGSGSFGAGASFATGTNPLDVKPGDVNGDGNLDIVTANRNDNSVSVLLGNGAGSFTAAVGSPVTVGANPTSVALGDVDKDGKLDMAVANYSGPNVTLLKGDGTGGFTTLGSPITLGTGTGPASVVLADVSGDGNLDLITSNQTSGNLTVRLGNGLGGFGSAANFAAGNLPYQVAVGSVNGDNYLDLLVVNRNSNNVTVLLNNGAGDFTPASGSPFDVGTGPIALALGAFKNDGALSIVTADYDADSVSVLTNPAGP
jgi:hypothetical protein